MTGSRAKARSIDEARRGRYIVLDGVDGCGKSTQAARLVRAWTVAGEEAPLHLREPGSTAAGERIRTLLLDPSTELGAPAETLLFAAARRQMLDEVVRPALQSGRDVVCERSNPSTFAYQAVAGSLDEELVLDLLARWAGDPAPDRVLILDVDPLNVDAGVAYGRATAGGAPDRIEARGVGFQARVAEGYRRYAARVAGVSLVDARGSEDEVAARVLAEVQLAAR